MNRYPRPQAPHLRPSINFPDIHDLATAKEIRQWSSLVEKLIAQAEDVRFAGVVLPREVHDADVKGGTLRTGAAQEATEGYDLIAVQCHTAAPGRHSLHDSLNPRVEQGYELPKTNSLYDVRIISVPDEDLAYVSRAGTNVELSTEYLRREATADELIVAYNLLAGAVGQEHALIPIKPEAKLAALGSLGLRAPQA